MREFSKGTMKGKGLLLKKIFDYCSLPSRGWFSVPFIPFTLGENRDGRVVGRNQELGLVIKIFRDDEAFFREHQVYKLLSEKACPYVPKFFGCFENTFERFSLVMSYEGQQVDEALSESDRQEPFFFFTPFCLTQTPFQ